MPSDTFTKQELQAAKEILQTGILRRHEEWQRQLVNLINKPYEPEENIVDRNMKITKMSKDFYKEAMAREDYYRNQLVHIGIVIHLREGFLTKDDLSSLPENIQQDLIRESQYKKASRP